ncbi:Gfo/Idh/MocA family protein [Enterococcus sp. LJL90]
MKLAITGAGMIVKDFLTITKDLPEIELQAIVGVDADLENMQALQEQYNIKEVFTDYETCLKEADIDTVYVAVPNHLHYAFAKKALEHGKHVVCEKPFTLKLAELIELKNLAQAADLILVEAITNQYLANYRGIKEATATLGDLKLIECNYSQYSSRYDAFKAGTILPAFNPKMGGGALMDINIYNIHFVVGVLGRPSAVNYFANLEKDIDTSGMLVLDYQQTKVVCIGAKDSTAKIRSTIQGTKGSLIVNGPTNVVDSYAVEMNGTEAEEMDQKVYPHRMYEEFKTFAKMIADKDLAQAATMMSHSEIVMEVVEAALADAGITLG